MEDKNCPPLNWRHLPKCSRKTKSIKSKCTNLQDQPKNTKTTNLTKLEFFRLSCNTKEFIFPRRWLSTWFMCTRRSLAEDLAAWSGSFFLLMQLHFLWVVYCGRLDFHISYFTNSLICFCKKCSSVRIFRQPYVHDIKYNKVL